MSESAEPDVDLGYMPRGMAHDHGGLDRRRLHPYQALATRIPATWIMFVGGLGSGKSVGGAAWATKQLSLPRNRMASGMITAPTYQMLRDATMPTFWRFAEGVLSRRALNKSDMELPLPWGGRILFRATSEPDRLRGPNLSWVWMDEAAMTSEYGFKIIASRLREGGRLGKGFVSTTPAGRDWIYRTGWLDEPDYETDQRGRLRLKRRPDGSAYSGLVRVELADNRFAGSDYIAMMYQLYRGEQADQELRGLFVGHAGAGFTFREDRHVVRRDACPPYSTYQHLRVGVDEGTAAPRVAELVGFHGQDRYVLEEDYRVEPRDEAFCRRMQELQASTGGRITQFRVDPSAVRLMQSLRDAGLPVMSADNNRVQGWGAMRSAMAIEDGRTHFHVAQTCENLIAQLVAARRIGRKNPDTGELEYLDDIVGVDDHSLDACRYGLYDPVVMPTGGAARKRRR